MENTKLEIYPERKKRLEQELNALKQADISNKNKELITQFQNYLFSTGSGELRVAKLSAQLRAICRWLKHALKNDKDLDKLNKTDVMNLIAFINQIRQLSEATRADYRRLLKQFFKWYKQEDTRVYSRNNEKLIEAKKFYEYVEKEIRMSYVQLQIDPTTILTDEDVFLVVEKGCKTPKEKAFLAVLHETGCRAGEFLNLRVGDVVQKESYAEIHIPYGKTGKRTIYITKSLPYLLRYLDVHAFKDNKNSYLWLGEARRHLNAPLLHKGSQKLIDRCFNRVGMTKKHNFHWFRHSRASLLAPHITEVMLCKYMGWVIGSDQVKTYVHLCSRQVEDVFLAMHGIKTKEEQAEQPVKCVCGALNSKRERYCFKCYRPLSVEVITQDKELIDTEINKTMNLLLEIAKNPELMKKFEEFKKNMA